MTHLILNTSIAVIIAYLLGSIPTGYLFGKIFKKIDIRQHGSGNMGATNALRILGPGIGITVLLIDMFKGFFAVLIGKFLIFSVVIPQIQVLEYMVVLVALAAIFGHIFTIFLGFKGGKGVATAAGVFAAMIPFPLMFGLMTFIIIVVLTRYVSLGSIMAALILLFAQFMFYINTSSGELPKLLLVILIVVFIIYKHKANIVRLVKGTENKISFTKKG